MINYNQIQETHACNLLDVENKRSTYSNLHAIEEKSKEERFYRFMELSSEPGTLGYGVLLVMNKRALDLRNFG
jgi:hypothetical protein